VISCHILRLSLFFIDIPQNQTTLYIFLGRDYTIIRLHTHTYVETLISSLLTFIANGRRFSLFVFLVRFLSIRFGGRFQWNGRWVQAIPLPIYAEYFSTYHTLCLPTAVLHRSPGCNNTFCQQSEGVYGLLDGHTVTLIIHIL
jgi:hypothetical protein